MIDRERTLDVAKRLGVLLLIVALSVGAGPASGATDAETAPSVDFDDGVTVEEFEECAQSLEFGDGRACEYYGHNVTEGQP